MKKEYKTIILCAILTVIIILSIITGNEITKDVVTNPEIRLSNKKIEWGIQRKNNHEQPNLGKNNVK